MKVVNKRKTSYDVYIGRPSIWGNPFSIGENGDRRQVIVKFKEYLDSNFELLSQVHLLKGKTLGCWCKPYACHGDYLVEVVDTSVFTFEGVNRYLSNFYPSKVWLNGHEFPTVENAYQYAKAKDDSRVEEFINSSPGAVKRLGRKIEVREDWEEIKMAVMRELLSQKFGSGSMRERLLGTFPGALIEGNHWNDQFWGVCNGVGQNHLGRLLMEIRYEFSQLSISS